MVEQSWKIAHSTESEQMKLRAGQATTSVWKMKETELETFSQAYPVLISPWHIHTGINLELFNSYKFQENCSTK